MKTLTMAIVLLMASISWAASEQVVNCTGDKNIKFKITESARVIEKDKQTYKVVVWTFATKEQMEKSEGGDLWNWEYVVPTKIEYIDDQEPIPGKNYDFWVDSEDKLSLNVYADGEADGKRFNTDLGSGSVTPLKCKVAE